MAAWISGASEPHGRYIARNPLGSKHDKDAASRGILAR